MKVGAVVAIEVYVPTTWYTRKFKGEEEEPARTFPADLGGRRRREITYFPPLQQIENSVTKRPF
jgi:hypothetical protein